MKKSNIQKTRILRIILIFAVLMQVSFIPVGNSIAAQANIPDMVDRAPVAVQEGGIPTPPPTVTNEYYSSRTITAADGTLLDEMIINGPPHPPAGFDDQRKPVTLPETNQPDVNVTLTVPAYEWVFGCSSVSGAMIAAYYDRNSFPLMYTGPTNGGVMPMDSSGWPTWSDGDDTYPNNPLIASHNGLDGRATRGSIDDYWMYYGSADDDPYIPGGWTQHTWGTAIGDYMKTSQSAYDNVDGSTNFYTYSSSASALTCSDMVTYAVSTLDGTYGRKLFYEARGYTVTDCYSQRTDNNGGGFTFSMYKTEIDNGNPVLLNLDGHSIVGVGYESTTNTVYLHDTWDFSTHSMTWGSSYSGMSLLSVSIVHLAGSTPTAPEMDVKGNNVSIADGDTTPSTTDYTDFGSTPVAGGTVSRTFTVYNTGTANLSLSGTPKVSLSGTNAADFSVTAQPSSPVAPAGSTIFTVVFDPSAAGLRSAALSIANDDANENPYNFSIQGTGTVAPEMDVKGNSVSIADGDTTPSTADYTDFGSTSVTGGTVARTFTVYNTGDANLSLTGTPKVSLSGTNSADFSVTLQPSSPVAPAGSTTFTVVFDPSAAGLRTATLSIANDDANENPYDFAIQGTGSIVSAPEMDVKGNSVSIADGDTTPSTADYTDFGSTSVSGGTVARTFTVYNTGDANLSLTGTPKVSLSGTNSADFSVTLQPSSPVAPAGSTSFTVVFDPSAAGLRTATLSIANDDANENPYDFAIQGTGTTSVQNIKINEVNPDTPDWIEFYNPTAQPVDMTGWVFQNYDGNGTLSASYTFPSFTLQPGAYVVVYEYSGTNTATTLYTGGNIDWLAEGGAAGLNDDAGAAVDFMRWGSSSVVPPSGGSWTGTNPAGPDAAHTLGRDSGSTDTNDGSDWCLQNPTPGVQNVGCLACLTPAAPSLNSPRSGQGLNDTTPLFDWSAVSGANAYQLIIDDNVDFQTPILDVQVTPDQYQFASALPEATYYWKVYGINNLNGCNVTGPWSDVSNFYITTQTSFSLQSTWSTSAPAVDGQFSAGEWASARTVNVTIPGGYRSELFDPDRIGDNLIGHTLERLFLTPSMPDIAWQPVTLYIMNDATHLYLAFDNPNDTISDLYDQMGVYFDDNPLPSDGTWSNGSCGNSSGEGNFWIYPDSETDYREIVSGPTFCSYVTPAPGVIGMGSFSSGHLHLEAAIDLTNSALLASLGNSVKMYLWIYDDNRQVMNGVWPLGADYSDPATYQTLILANSPAVPGDFVFLPSVMR